LGPDSKGRTREVPTSPKGGGVDLSLGGGRREVIAKGRRRTQTFEN